MQHPQVQILAPGGVVFQYPRSDRRRCNSQPIKCPRCGEWPFSILGRIGGDATYWTGPGEDLVLPFSILGRIGGDATCSLRRDVTWRKYHFQYPRSDRRRCNDAASRTTAAIVHPPFSILGRIGGDATSRDFNPKALNIDFQYPRSDRRRCNHLDRYLDDLLGIFLSVSSVGSEAMQRGSLLVKGRVIKTFSILGRIGGDATKPMAIAITIAPMISFQYPRSDRRRCNLPEVIVPASSKTRFQYPRSDRRRCNDT